MLMTECESAHQPVFLPKDSAMMALYQFFYPIDFTIVI
ncbi:hypothetical protein MAMP_02374 [Methylophaga aminisulfidivorans MP]|uniref:Uncharacterized protein n=1 Tax=Methylophaga aminisulfidivorans MP TaxID=1026882 RepID=F5SWD3_9GAMM|nr:hypothetical protein MAMP_02374 [Methylophaga aminisulfidivorans MP]